MSDYLLDAVAQHCTCGVSECYGECPCCAVHYPYEHTANCSLEEEHAVMEAACAEYDRLVAQDDLFARALLTTVLHDPGVYP